MRKNYNCPMTYKDFCQNVTILLSIINTRDMKNIVKLIRI